MVFTGSTASWSGRYGAKAAIAGPRGMLRYIFSVRGAKQIAKHTAFGAAWAVAFDSYVLASGLSEGPSMLPTLEAREDRLVYVKMPLLRFWARWQPTAWLGDQAQSRPEVPTNNVPRDGLYWTTRSNKSDRTMGYPLAIGDLVVATSPRDPWKEICKRIIGLPGDKVLIDPRIAPQPVAPSDDAGRLDDDDLEAFARKTIGRPAVDGVDGETHRALPVLDENRYVTVPPGHLFLAGDNMSNSTDSRAYGTIPIGCLKGKVVARVSR